MKKLLGWALVSVMASACGDDGPPDVDTGIPDSTPLVDLTDEQAVQACIAFERWDREEAGGLVSDRDLCTIFAVAFTEDAASCEGAITACLNAEPEPETEPENTPEEECAGETAPELSSTCDVTVGEIEACTNARIDATRRLVGDLDCSYAGDEARLEALEDRYEPEICRDIERRCPELEDSDVI